MKKLFVVLAALFLLPIIACSGGGGDDGDTSTPAASSKVVNIDDNQLPKGYTGDNSRIVEILKKSYVEKGEFETFEAYTKRKEAVGDKTYAFSYKPRRSDEHDGLFKKELSYDIEKKSFRINLSSFKAIEKLWDDVKRSYIAQNAFGAKSIIKEGTRNRYYITLPKENFDYDLKVEPSNAKLAIENIRFLYWVKLQDVKCRQLEISPSRDNPFDGRYIECESLSIPVETWMYNFMTGEIYKKVKAEGEHARQD